MTEWLLIAVIFGAGTALGSYVTSKIVSARARRLLHIRGEALREIANHKWHTGDYNDAVVIARIALKGLEHKLKGMANE